MSYKQDEEVAAVIRDSVRHSLPDLITLLRRMEIILDPDDGVRSFCVLYRHVLMGFQQASEQNEWLEPEWVTRLNLRLIEHFLEQFYEPSGFTDSWEAFLKRRHAKHVSRLRFALAGAMPHIQHDLGLSLYEVWREKHFEPSVGQLKDFTLMSRIIAAQTVPVTQVLTSRPVATVFRLMDPLARTFNSAGMIWYRRLAWHDGKYAFEELLPDSVRAVFQDRDQSVAREVATFLFPA